MADLVIAPSTARVRGLLQTVQRAIAGEWRRLIGRGIELAESHAENRPARPRRLCSRRRAPHERPPRASPRRRRPRSPRPSSGARHASQTHVRIAEAGRAIAEVTRRGAASRAPKGIVSARETHCGARSDRPSAQRSPPCNNRPRVFRSRSSREARRLGGHSPLTSIFLTSFWASAVFGSVTVRTPFLKLASILSVSTVSGTLSARS